MICLFCQIAAHELPADIIFEDEEIIVFKDINPAAPVHVLIIPRKHLDSLNSLDEETASLGAKMLLTAKQIAESQGIQSGFRVLINTGRQAGQVVRHLHLHVMGGWGKKDQKPLRHSGL